MDSNQFNNENQNQAQNPYVQTVNVGGEPQAPVPPQVQPQVEVPVQPQAEAQVPPQQPVYQQPMYQQPMYYQPAPVAEDPAAKSRLAKKLCVISLILYGAAPAVFSTIAWMSDSGLFNYFDDAIVGVSSLLSSAAYIAAWVLMIIARVTDKKCVFAKVLMWVYIGMLILAVVTVIILIIACVEAMRSCGDSLSNCDILLLPWAIR